MPCKPYHESFSSPTSVMALKLDSLGKKQNLAPFVAGMLVLMAFNPRNGPYRLYPLRTSTVQNLNCPDQVSVCR